MTANPKPHSLENQYRHQQIEAGIEGPANLAPIRSYEAQDTPDFNTLYLISLADAVSIPRINLALWVMRYIRNHLNFMSIFY